MSLRLTVVLFALITSSARAAMEEVIVTADFYEAEEMSLPESVSILGEDVIRGRTAEHLEDVLGHVPNLNFAGGTSRARFLQIRGIGERSQFADPINPSVGLLIDNVDFSGAGTAATLLDVEQVEVLRGPQGTRYGANALAGLVKLKTHEPTDSPYATIEAMGGNYDQRSVRAVFSGPLSSDLGARIAIGQFNSDGYTYNAFQDRDDVNARDETSLRGKLAFGADNHRTVVAFAHVDIDNGYDAFSLDNTRTTLSDEPGRDRQRSNSISIDSTWQRDGFDLKLIGAASDSDIEYSYDEDWSFTGIHPFGYTSTDAYLRDRETRSVELRAVSSGETEWVAGLYVLDSAEALERRYTFLAGPFFSDYDFTSMAAFAQRRFTFGDRVSLSAGLRFERRDTGYTDSDGIAFSPTDDMWGGQLSLDWAATPNVLWYASLSRGYKAGGFNTDGSLDADLRQFGPEYLWELEGGIKAVLANGSVRLRSAVFHDWRRDQQVKSSIVRTRPDGSTEFIDFLGNAAEGNNRGIETQIDWYVSDAFALFANVGLLSAEFDEFINEFGENLSGREQAQSPSWTASVGADIDLAGFFARVSLDGKDAFFFSDRHSVTSDRYVLLNARVGYRFDSWTIALWGRNLTNQDVFVRGFGSFGNDPRKNYEVEPYRQYGEPRVFGLTVNVEIR